MVLVTTPERLRVDCDLACVQRKNNNKKNCLDETNGVVQTQGYSI